MGAEWNINVEAAADVSLTPVCEACGAVLSRGRHQNNCGKAAIEQAMDTTARVAEWTRQQEAGKEGVVA
jgi:hypothetical protein